MRKQHDRPFPLELISLVASFSTPGVLASICALSKDLNHQFTPSLYRHLIITRANVDKVFLGLPRCRELREPRQTKAEFKAEVDELRTTFKKVFDADDWDGLPTSLDGSRHNDEWGIVYPETDDEFIPLSSEINDESNRFSWERRMELFRFTEHLTFAQAPHRALAVDLVDAVMGMDPHLAGPGSTKRARHRMWIEREERMTWEHWDTYAGPTLFPNVTHMSFSSRCFRRRRLRQLNHVLNSPAFAQPRHACITLPRDLDVAAYARSSYGSRWKEAKPTGPDIRELAVESSSERNHPAVDVRDLLPPTVQTFTVHGLRRGHWLHNEGRTVVRTCIPYIRGLGTRNRIFYDPVREEPLLSVAIAETQQMAAEGQVWEFAVPDPDTAVAHAEQHAPQVRNPPRDVYGPNLSPSSPAMLAQAKVDLENAKKEEVATRDGQEAARVAAREDYLDALDSVAPQLAQAIRGLGAEVEALRAKRDKAQKTCDAFKGKSGARKRQLEVRVEELDGHVRAAEQDLEAMDNPVVARRFRKTREDNPELASVNNYLDNHREYQAALERHRRAERHVREAKHFIEELGERAVDLRRASHLKALDEAYGRPDEVASFRTVESASPCVVCGEKNKIDGGLKDIVDEAQKIVV